MTYFPYRRLVLVAALGALAGCGPRPGAAPRPTSGFELVKARGRAARVARSHPVTLYCGCDFTRDLVPEPRECGYVPRQPGIRSARVEWEHVVPPARFGRGRACWEKPLCRRADGSPFGGRRCCAATDPEFRAMEGDLHNLAPVVGELNGARSDFDFGEVAGEKREFGKCDFEVDTVRRIAEPPPAARGFVARAYLYMRAVYGLALRPEELALYERWHREHPPEPGEQQRALAIRELQGNGHPYVD